MTLKRKDFIKEYAIGADKGNATAAVIKAGYKVKSREVARVIGSTLLTKADVRQGITKILQRNGLDDEGITSRLKDAIDAGLGQKATNSDAIRGLEIALKLRGYLTNDQTIDNRSLTIELQGKSVKDLQNMLNTIRNDNAKYLIADEEQDSNSPLLKDKVRSAQRLDQVEPVTHNDIDSNEQGIGDMAQQQGDATPPPPPPSPQW